MHTRERVSEARTSCHLKVLPFQTIAQKEGMHPPVPFKGTYQGITARTSVGITKYVLQIACLVIKADLFTPPCRAFLPSQIVGMKSTA